MGVAHISEERRKAVLQLDRDELEEIVTVLQKVARILPEQHPARLAKLWSLTSPPKKPINVVTPSAAALKQRLGVDQLDLGVLDSSYFEEVAIPELGRRNDDPTTIPHLAPHLSSSFSCPNLGPAMNDTPSTNSRVSPSMSSSFSMGPRMNDYPSRKPRTNDSRSLSPSSKNDFAQYMQPTPPAWAGSSLAMVSRGFGQSLEEAYAGLGRLKEIEKTTLEKKKASSVSSEDSTKSLLVNAESNFKEPCSTGARRLRRVAPEISPWKGCYTTSSGEHNNSRISSLLYCSSLEAFAADWEHKGWLISSSPKLLNLWVCSRKSSGQPLELMHSQPTASTVEAMDIDYGSKVLMSAACPPHGRGFRVILHSLSSATLFKFQGAIQIPERFSADIKNQIYGSTSKLVYISSLNPFKGPLGTSLAVGVGVEVLVYDLAAATMVDAISAPKGVWKAHDSAISSMHVSPFGCHLITGACDGAIKVWDLRNRPTAPVHHFAHQKQVTGLAMLDKNTLSSSGGDCSIQFWDMRSGNKAISSLVPDGKPVLNMSSACCSPNLLGFTTRQGLYCLEFCGPDGLTTMLSPLKPLPPVGPCTDVKWNTLSKQVYAACVNGSISVYGSAAYMTS